MDGTFTALWSHCLIRFGGVESVVAADEAKGGGSVLLGYFHAPAILLLTHYTKGTLSSFI